MIACNKHGIARDATACCIQTIATVSLTQMTALHLLWVFLVPKMPPPMSFCGLQMCCTNLIDSMVKGYAQPE